MVDIGRLFTRTIERTINPLAPLILQEASTSCSKIGRLMAPLGTKAATDAHADKLLSAYPKEMDAVAGSPDFIIALTALLDAALVQFVKES